MITNYHARYFAHELTRRRAADGIGRLSQSLFDACVDLNPHQIDVAIFALRSPLDSSAVLADKVGLGKTIEAGVLLCQHWAERCRNMIVVCPASLRRQCAAEQEKKFNLPALVLDCRTLAEADGNPLDAGRAVAVMSYNFAARLSETLYAVPWDLAVIDKAHKLRNVHRPGNVTSQRIKRAFAGQRKVLLTATLLQNSLMELYELGSLLDDYIFGDQAAFRTQFAGPGANLDVLHGWLRAFCYRPMRGSWGWLSLHLVTLESFEREEFLVLSGIDRHQKPLDSEMLDKLFACDGLWQSNAAPPHVLTRTVLEETTKGAIGRTLAVAEAHNARFLEEQRIRLERWADNRLFAAEKEPNDIKARLKDLARQAHQTADPATPDPAGQLAIQRQIQDAEKAKRRARQRIFNADAEILGERVRLIEALGRRLNRRTNIRSYRSPRPMEGPPDRR